MAENSADSRTPDDIYLELRQQASRARFFDCVPRCRDGCRNLLNNPRLLPSTRVQTLHMLAKLCLSEESEETEKCLRVAARILDKLDPEDPLTKTLRDTNEHMVTMMGFWYPEQDGVGKGVEGVDYEGEFVGLIEEKKERGKAWRKLKLKWFRAAFKRKPRMTS